MRILSVTAQKPHSTGSGVYLTELVNSFHELSHEQAVLAGVYEEDKVNFPEGVEFCPVYYRTRDLPFAIAGMSDEMPYKSTKYSDMNEDMAELFRDAFLKHLKPLVEEFKPELILCHHLYLLTAYVREAFPECLVCGICHGSDLRQISKNPLCEEEIKDNIRRLDRIFALHEEQKRQIMEIYHVPEEMIQVIGSGFNDQIFKRVYKEDDPKHPRLIFAGKLAEKKGVMSLIRSLDHIPGRPDGMTICLAGGSGSREEQDEIIYLAGKCPCQVYLPGRLAQEELAVEYGKSDVFVLPSFYEGLPLVVIEALACGVKVVCTDLPGIREWMDANVPGNGIVYVKPPAMKNTDEPVVEELPAFEKELALAIRRCLDMEKPNVQGLEKLSWKGICGKILENLYVN